MSFFQSVPSAGMHRRKMCPYYWGAVELKENEVGLVQDMYATGYVCLQFSAGSTGEALTLSKVRVGIARLVY